MWHEWMGHINFFGLKRLLELAEGIKIGHSKIDCCEFCELDWLSRKNSLFNFGHCAYRCLRKVSPEAVGGHCYAIKFEDSFSRFSKIYL